MAIKEKLRSLVGWFYQPLVKKYLSVTRNYSYKNIHLKIPADVFHPGFFFSTKILLRYIESLNLVDKTFLELGAGSGLISFCAARRNAVVTAIDINAVAIDYLKSNAQANSCALTIIESDLFENVPPQQFDIIAINPPYFKKDPASQKEQAWYCGENGEYFQDLFSTLGSYIHKDSVVLMVLGEQCDLQMIRSISASHQFELKTLITKKNFFGGHIVYKIGTATTAIH